MINSKNDYIIFNEIYKKIIMVEENLIKLGFSIPINTIDGRVGIFHYGQ